MADENNQEQNSAPAVKPEEEMTQEELTALHEAEDFIEKFDPKDLADEDKRADLEKRLEQAKTTVAQKRHYRDKVKELTKPKPAAPAQPATPAAPEKKDEVKGVDPQVATDFRLDHPELSKEQAKTVLKHAGAYGITPEEALADPYIKSYIQNTTTAEDVDDASPAPRTRSGSGIAEKDWSSATPQEMEQARIKILHPNG